MNTVVVVVDRTTPEKKPRKQIHNRRTPRPICVALRAPPDSEIWDTKYSLRIRLFYLYVSSMPAMLCARALGKCDVRKSDNGIGGDGEGVWVEKF